jgi:hypothetical protein
MLLDMAATAEKEAAKQKAEEQAAKAAAAAKADPDYDLADEPMMPPLSLFTVKGDSGNTAFVVDPSTGGGFGVQINAGHGEHAKLVATTCTQMVPAGVSGSSSSGRNTRSGVGWWEEIRFEVQHKVRAGEELLYDYQCAVPEGHPDHSIRCACPHAQPHYLYQEQGKPLGEIRYC